MATFDNDTFSGTTGTTLETHTGPAPQNNTWALSSGVSGAAVLNGSGYVRASTKSQEAFYVANGVAASANYSVQADVKFASLPSASDIVGIAIRASNGANTGYKFIYFQGNWQIYKYVSGTPTALGNAVAVSPSAGSTYTLKVTANGSSLTGYVNGTATCTAIDSAITATGFAGIEINTDSVTPSDSNGLLVANFSAFDPSSNITIAVNDLNWLHSPRSCYGDGAGSMQANNIRASSTVVALLTPGAYGRIKVQSTGNLSLNVDVSRTSGAGVSAGNYPILTYSIDDGRWFDAQLTSSSTTVDALSGGTVGTHDLRYEYKAGYTNTDKWDGSGSPSIPPAAIVITGATVDSGASTVAAPANAGGIDYIFGDSITEGLRVINTTDAPTGNDATAAFPGLIAAAYGSDFAELGYGATGYESSGQGSVPNFSGNYSLYFGLTTALSAGQFIIQPTRIWVFHGTNGTTLQSDVATMIANLRTAAPNAWIFMCVPPGGFARSSISAAVAAAGDAKVKCLDAGTAFQAGLTTFNSGTAEATDGVHPRALTHAQYAAIIVRQAIGYTNPGMGANATTLTIHDSGGSPLSGANVWITTDAAGTNTVTSVLQTNGSGQVTFNLTTGNTYYAWVMKDNSHGSAVGTSFTA